MLVACFIKYSMTLSVLYDIKRIPNIINIDKMIWAIFLYLNLLEILVVITPIKHDKTIGIIGSNKSIIKLVK